MCLQVLGQIPELRAIFSGRPSFISITGRDTEVLQRIGDSSGAKHVELYKALSNLSSAVTSGVGKAPADITNAVVGASRGINKAWGNEKNDAAAYYSFLMEVIDIVTDQSKHIDKADISERLDSGGWRRRPAYRPEEELNVQNYIDIAEGVPLVSLQTHAQQHWEAHLASGHQSSKSDVTTIQYVEALLCSSKACSTVLRTVKYADHIMLMLPTDLSTETPIPLEELMRFTFTYQGQAPRLCPNQSHSYESQEERSCLTKKITRIARAGKIFAVEISRQRQFAEDDSSENSRENADQRLHRNRISKYKSIHLG